MPVATSDLVAITPVDHGPGSKLSFGAIATGIDLENLDEASFKILEDAIYRHKVLIIKDQKHMTPPKQFEFVTRLDPAAPKEHSAGPRKDTQERLRPDRRTLLEEYKTPDLVDFPEVRMVGNGKVDTPHYGLTGEVVLKQAGHSQQHKTPMSKEEMDAGFSRWLRWHMDIACFVREPPFVTTLHCIKNPIGPPLTVKWDDGTDTTMQVPAGATAFTDSANTFRMLSPADQLLAENSRAEYWPHPYRQNGNCKIRNLGLGFLDEGLELPLEELPEYDEKDVKIYPLVWHNPVTGEKALSVHSVCVRRLFLKVSPDGEERVMDDLAEVRALLFKWQRPAVVPENIWAPAYEEGDMVAFANRYVYHCAVEVPDSYGPRLLHQAQVTGSVPPS